MALGPFRKHFLPTKVLHFWYEGSTPVISLCWKRWTDGSVVYFHGISLLTGKLVGGIANRHGYPTDIFSWHLQGSKSKPPWCPAPMSGPRPKCPWQHSWLKAGGLGCWIHPWSLTTSPVKSYRNQQGEACLPTIHFQGVFVLETQFQSNVWASFQAQEVYESWLNFENHWILYTGIYAWYILIYHILVYAGIIYTYIYIKDTRWLVDCCHQACDVGLTGLSAAFMIVLPLELAYPTYGKSFSQLPLKGYMLVPWTVSFGCVWII